MSEKNRYKIVGEMPIPGTRMISLALDRDIELSEIGRRGYAVIDGAEYKYTLMHSARRGIAIESTVSLNGKDIELI